MAFVREIGKNGVLYSGIWPRHRVSNRIELNRYIGKSVAINQIEKIRDINDILINYCALRACYGVSNQKTYQLIESIKFYNNDITSYYGTQTCSKKKFVSCSFFGLSIIAVVGAEGGLGGSFKLPPPPLPSSV